MADSQQWWRGSGNQKSDPLAPPRRTRGRVSDIDSNWRNHGVRSGGSHRPPAPGSASTRRPKRDQVPIARPMRFPLTRGEQQNGHSCIPRPHTVKSSFGCDEPPALFLQAQDGTTKTVFSSESENDNLAVTNATLEVRPVATYRETHREGDVLSFEPWQQAEGKHPPSLAFDFINTFPSAHAIKRTTLPDIKHFYYGNTTYDPNVSVVEHALTVPDVCESLSKFPPDMLADGVGLLAGILKRSLRLSRALPKHKRRSVVRLSAPKNPTKSSKLKESTPDCDTDAHHNTQGPVRLFCDNPTWYLDDCLFGPRFEYICTTPDEKGDDDLHRNRVLVQPYGGFRVILELKLTPEIDGQMLMTKQHSKPEPITILMCTEVDASDMNDPNTWVELKASNKIAKRSTFNQDSWCQAVLAGCQRAVTLFHNGDKILDIDAFDVSTTESTKYVQNPRKHLAYLYHALRNIASLAKKPGEKFIVAENPCSQTNSWRKSSR